MAGKAGFTALGTGADPCVGGFGPPPTHSWSLLGIVIESDK